MYGGFDGCNMFSNLFHEREKRINDRIQYSMSNPSWGWREVSEQRNNMDNVWHTRRPASGLCCGLELPTDTIEMVYTTALMIRTHAARRIHLRRLKNETIERYQQRVGIGECAITTHSAYAISEYNEVYADLICNTLKWKGTASPLTDNVKPIMLGRGFDSTKDDEIIAELWEQLKFLARFLL
jgi:hypothetical protein